MAPPRVLFVSLTNDTGAERLPVELIRLGAECACLSPPGFQCTRVRGIAWLGLPAHRGLWLGALALAGALSRTVARFVPDLIVPLDDLSAWILRGLANSGRAAPLARALIERSLGAQRGYAAARWRTTLMSAAVAAGVPVPDHEAMTLRAVLDAADRHAYPIVIKEENSCGGRGVVVAQDAAELRAALDSARTGTTASRWIKRLRGASRRAMWNAAGMPTEAWGSLLVQAYVAGPSGICTVVAREGRVVEAMSLRVERSHPHPTGASTVVRIAEHAAMEAHARALVARLGCSGFVSFDFILGTDERDATLIEMNARPVGTVHLGRMFGRDLGTAFLRLLQVDPQPDPCPTIVDTRRVALFPKELERDPTVFRHGVPANMLHDVPWLERAIVDDYVQALCRLHPDHAQDIHRQTLQSAEVAIPGQAAAHDAGPGGRMRRRQTIV